MILGSGQKVKG